MAGADTRIFTALQRVNELRSYTLPQFSLAGRYTTRGTAQELLVLRNHVVVACETPSGGEMIWLNLRDMTRMGQMPLPFALLDMLYSPVTRSIYALSRDGVHLLQIDSIGRRVVTQILLPRPGRRLLLVER